MKKWFLPPLMTLLLLTAVGCDEAPLPSPLPETVDGLTLVTTADATVTPSEPLTEPDTTPAETLPDTQLPEVETETLSPEEASALLDEVLLKAALPQAAPIEVHMTSDIGLTAHMFGFTGTTTIPLSVYYALDEDLDVMIAYAVPMESTGVFILSDGMLYLHDGADIAKKAPVDEASLQEVRDLLLQRLKDRLSVSVPKLLPPKAPAELLPLEPSFPDVLPNVLPDALPDFTELFKKVLTSVPFEDAFSEIHAYRDPATDTYTLVLSGISQPILDALEEFLTLLPSEQELPATQMMPEGGHTKLSKDTLQAVVTLLREQSDKAFTLTLTADRDLEVTEVSALISLDLTSLPHLTAHMPVELTVTTRVAVSRDGVVIEAPEDADRYEEIPLSQLLPPVPPALEGYDEETGPSPSLTEEEGTVSETEPPSP